MRWAQYVPLVAIWRGRKKAHDLARRHPDDAREILDATEAWARVRFARWASAALFLVPAVIVSFIGLTLEWMSGGVKIVASGIAYPFSYLSELTADRTEDYLAIRRRLEPPAGFGIKKTSP